MPKPVSASNKTGDMRPVYVRLRDKIVAAILTGRFAEGELLPSVRAFAAEHGANPLTVAKAYQQFQDDGLVAVRRGIGVELLKGSKEALLDAERARFLDEEWPTTARRIALLKLDPDRLLDRISDPIG